METAISDAEVEHNDEDGNFYHIKYFFKDSEEYLTTSQQQDLKQCLEILPLQYIQMMRDIKIR